MEALEDDLDVVKEEMAKVEEKRDEARERVGLAEREAQRAKVRAHRTEFIRMMGSRGHSRFQEYYERRKLEVEESASAEALRGELEAAAAEVGECNRRRKHYADRRQRVSKDKA